MPGAWRHRFPVLVLLLGGTWPATARQDPRTASVPTEIPRLETDVRIDGHVEDAEWAGIPVLPLIQFAPTWGDPIVHPTEIRLAYDDQYLYLSARCGDVQPPTRTTYRRDAWSDRDDQVAIGIDSFNDYENQVAFALYATGARIDAQFSDDARDEGNMSTDWNTFWDAEAVSHDTGWEGEMRIPFSSLRFQAPADGPVTMGINVMRFRADGGFFYQYPGVPNDWGFWSFLKPSKGARRQLMGIRSSNPVYVAPYVSGGLGQRFELNQAEDAYLRDDTRSIDAGVDLKASLTSNLTLDLTVNTDFAQVEADDQQVNLTRFSLFFPEKRQFFLERSSTFDFSFGGSDRLFYSRQVGLYEGSEVALLGGGRLVGRIGGWDVGFLTLQTGSATVETDGEREHLESENFGVLRVKRRVLNANSWLGGITTTRLGGGDRNNVAYGLDGQINPFGDELVRFAWAQTFDDGAGDVLASLDNSRFRLLWERPRSTGVRYEAGLSRAGYGYRPGAGYQRREDYTQLKGEVGYGRLSESASTVRNWGLDAEVDAYYENRRRVVESVSYNAGGHMGFRSGANVRADITLDAEDLVEGFDLSDDADIPAGRYTFVHGEVGGQTASGSPLKLGAEVRFGQFFDGRQVIVGLSSDWSVSDRISLSGIYEYDRIGFPDRDQTFRAHVMRSRIDLTMSTKVTFSGFVQYSTEADALVTNVRFRYNPRDGDDFFLVYNEGIHTDRRSGIPMLPFTSGRTIIAKLVHTFRR